MTRPVDGDATGVDQRDDEDGGDVIDDGEREQQHPQRRWHAAADE